MSKNSRDRIGLFFLVAVVVLLGVGLALMSAGFPWASGAGQFALGYLAAGDFSIGIFAAGTFAIGVFAAGIFAIGIFSIGV